MKINEKITRKIDLMEEQNYALEGWKHEYKKSCNQIIGKMIDYYIKNPDKLKSLLKEDK